MQQMINGQVYGIFEGYDLKEKKTGWIYTCASETPIKVNLRQKEETHVFEKGKGKFDDSYYLKIKDRMMVSYNSSIFSLPKVKKDKIWEESEINKTI